MESTIFHTILKAIQSGEVELLEFADLDPEESSSTVESLFDLRNGLERYLFRVHLCVRLPAPGRHLRIVMPSAFHETAGAWLIDQYTKWSERGLIGEVGARAMHMLWSPRISNFTGNYAGSVKEPDLSFIPIGSNGLHRDFPSVVLESGWATMGPELVDNRRLWHEGSSGCVRVVILAKLYGPNAQNQVSATLEISHTAPTGPMAHIIHWNVFPIPDHTPRDPTLTMEELFGGECPPGLNPNAILTLEVGTLRRIMEACLIGDGYLPA